MSEEALPIAVKRREPKSKEEKERYTHLNAEFQRIARSDKKRLPQTIFLYFFFVGGDFDHRLLYNVTNLRP